MTNREWLNSLSDEEFAKEYFDSIIKFYGGMQCCSKFCTEGFYDCNEKCKENITKWLKANKEA